jgi:hypothetical protein
VGRDAYIEGEGKFREFTQLDLVPFLREKASENGVEEAHLQNFKHESIFRHHLCN